MTDEMAPVGVESTPPVPSGDSSSSPGDGLGEGSGTTGTTGAARRRRRGGRGRGGGGRSGTPRAAADGSSGSDDAGPADEKPEIDLDAQPGETERGGNATIVEDEAPALRNGAGPAGTTSSARRRRRGGRGRGGGSRTTASTSATAETEMTDGGGEAEPRDAAPRGRVASSPRPRTRPAAPRTRTPAAPEGDAEPREDDLESSDEAATSGGDVGGATTGTRRRRRRGGRGRGRGTGSSAGAATSESPDANGAGPDAAATTEPRGSRSRSRSATRTTAPRTRTRRSASSEGASSGDEGADAPTSTRLKRQRQSRQIRRRRDVMPTVERITDKLMAITEHGERDQIAVLEGRDLVQHYVTRQGATSMVGNVYLGRVQNVLPGMEAAFVDVGRGRNAVLYAGEVNWSPEDLEGAPPRIEHVLKSGGSVLVQVTKDPIGGKGARLTAQISLPGRFLVLAPNSNVTGISRRLPDAERQRLKSIYKAIKPEEHGLIVRTAAEGASEEALADDLKRLVATWEAIEKRSKKAKAPDVLYEEPELTLRVVRDLFTDEEYRELVTDSPRIYELITDYLRDVAPDLLAKVRLHQGKLSVFEEFHIVEQIHKGLDRKVWLPSGGYLVIDRTEAMTVIDVNTGKAVGKTNLEETVATTNIEAAREVARQLRLRDIGGMIVIDFIDMLLEQNKRKVLDAMRESMALDKTRSQVFDISPLGLLEVTRKRVSGGLLESFSETCPTCEGRGVLTTYDVN